MALISDGLQNLAGMNLPNVKIENIVLSVGQDAEPESNPHIDSVREVIFVGTSGNKQIQKGNFASKLSQKQLANKDFFVDITVSILNVESMAQSLILGQVNYLDFVYVKIVQSLNQELTDELLNKNYPVNYEKLTNRKYYTEKIFKLSDFYDNKTFVAENVNTKNKIYSHTKQIRFTSKNPKKEHLDIFAYSYIDMQELINSFELNLTSDYELKGYVSKENVISKGNVANDSYILVDQNNNIFVGTPIKGQNGKFLKRKPRTATDFTTETLNVATVTNKKVLDLRNIDEIDQNLNANLAKPSITNKDKQLKEKIPNISNSGYVSELYTSRQKSNVYSSFFAFDIISFLKDNSNNPEIYNNTEALNLIKIKKLSLIRERVKTVDSIVYPFREYTEDKTIISTNENRFGQIQNKFSFNDQYNNLYITSLEDIEKNNFASSLPNKITVQDLRKVASISEITFPNAVDFRCFTFTDFEMAKLTTGEYRYSISIDVEDQTYRLVEMKLDKLNNIRNKLLKYLADAELPNMFSATENRQSSLFIKTQQQKYRSLNVNTAIAAGTINQSLTIQKAPWIEIPSALISVQKEMNLNVKNDDDITKKTRNYYNSLNPTTTSPKSILNLIDTVDKLISQIKQKYNTEEKQNKNDVSSQSRNIKSLSIIHTFKNVINADKKKIGFDFLNIEEKDPKLSFFSGIPTISKTSFDLRVNNEIKKYFPSATDLSLGSLNASISIDDQTSLGDITTYSTCYFTPSVAVMENMETVSLDSIDSSNLNLETYDSIVNASISTNNSKDMSVNNELLTKTNTSISTIKNIASNIGSTIQLSFSKPNLFVNADEVFDNAGFNTIDRPYTIEEICKLSNPEIKDETNLIKLSPLTNLLLDDVIRPTAINDTTTDLVSIKPLNNFDINSSNSEFNSIKTAMNAEVKVEQSTNVDILVIAGVNNTTTATTGGNALTYAGLSAVPLQTKSLMLDTVVSTKFKLSSFGFDPFLHPSTKNFMRLNFQNICQLQYLAGFATTNKKPNLNKPIWKRLTKKQYDSFIGSIIVRTKPYFNKMLNIGTETGLQFTLYNEFSILEKNKITKKNPIEIQVNTQDLLPNINLNINNTNVNTINLLNNLNISADNSFETQIAKQLIILNTVDSQIKPTYTYSKLELNNVNK